MDGVPNEKAEPEVTLLLRVMEMKLKVLYGIPYNVVYSLSCKPKAQGITKDSIHYRAYYDNTMQQMYNHGTRHPPKKRVYH